MEERFIQNVSGVLSRLRLLQHLSHPIGESRNYWTGFAAIRLNLDEKGQGPVSGFEQSRTLSDLAVTSVSESSSRAATSGNTSENEMPKTAATM